MVPFLTRFLWQALMEGEKRVACLQKNLDCLFWGARAGTDVGHKPSCGLILSGIGL